MPPETFTFACPACNTRLTVPVSLAGVIGPCPSCGTKIQAPTPPAARPQPQIQAEPPPPQPAAPYPVPSAPAAPVAPQAPPPVEAPLPQQIYPQAAYPTTEAPYPQAPVQSSYPQAPAQSAYPSPTPAYVPQPVPQPVYYEPPPVPAPVEEPRGVYRPEPRELPNRPEGKEPIGRPVPEDRRGAYTPSSSEPRRGWIYRIFIPIFFIAAGVGVIFAVASYMKSHDPQKPISIGTSSSQSDPVRKIKPEDDVELPPSPLEPDENDPVVPPAENPAQGRDPNSQLDQKPSAANEALKTLEKFLVATDLKSRLELLETQTPTAELEASCLNGPLPPTDLIEAALQAKNRIENFTDFYFKVNFRKENGALLKHEILIRRRGDQSPKVVIDPFLDTYGGRLKAFIENPAPDKSGTFQVYLSANSVVGDTSIPNYEKKVSIKLLSEPTGKEIATAYAGKASAIGEMLFSDPPELVWGRATACTIMVYWNTKDNPAHPYIEAATIKCLAWNP